MFVVEWTLRREEDKSQKVSLLCFREMNGEIGGREREEGGNHSLHLYLPKRKTSFSLKKWYMDGC